MTVKKILIVLNLLAIVGTLIWLKAEHSWEPVVGIITLIGTLIALLYNDGNNGNGVSFSQKGGKNSKNYQSNKDININN